jgi:hypothetical protein
VEAPRSENPIPESEWTLRQGSKVELSITPGSGDLKMERFRDEALARKDACDPREV